MNFLYLLLGSAAAIGAFSVLMADLIFQIEDDRLGWRWTVVGAIALGLAAGLWFAVLRTMTVPLV